MEKYGTYVTFQSTDDPKTTVNVPFDEFAVIDEMEKSAAWTIVDNQKSEICNGEEEKS
jgi:hypothetical protein